MAREETAHKQIEMVESDFFFWEKTTMTGTRNKIKRANEWECNHLSEAVRSIGKQKYLNIYYAKIVYVQVYFLFTSDCQNQKLTS